MHKNLIWPKVKEISWAWESEYLGSSLGRANLQLGSGQAYLPFWDSAYMSIKLAKMTFPTSFTRWYRCFENIFYLP